jgi:hypothetical protein
MQLLFVHGWSVTGTDTYGKMPEVLSEAAVNYDLDLEIKHIYLGKYISFHDGVTMDDIARAMDQALRDLPGNNEKAIKPFSCITHSTGGPVVRYWADKFYGQSQLKDLPLKHLVMLAPANHGSALAKLGKEKLGRLKAWFSGVEPGQNILDWLSLGSDGQWTLNESFMEYEFGKRSFFPFVLTGQGIDEKFYDFINSYLIENGSDGVIRVAGANNNYRYVSLEQTVDQIIRKNPLTYKLVHNEKFRKPENTPIGIYNMYSHCGKKMGIMQSVNENEMDAPIVQDILKCFKVNTNEDYQTRAKELEQLTQDNQKDSDRFCMLVFNIRDDQGTKIGMDDYDLFLLAGNQYQPQKLPKGFLKDRQMNDKTGRLVYYLDANKMNEIKDGKLGIRVVARPTKGFSYYVAAEFRSDGISAEDILVPNQTTYVDIKLHRFVDENVFRFGSASKKSASFKNIKPSGKTVGN